MLIPLKKIHTDLNKLHELVCLFFDQLDVSDFNEIVFPDWYDTIFLSTSLADKLEKFFLAYKNLPDLQEKQRVKEAFKQTNEVEKLCSGTSGYNAVKLENLHADIAEPISKLFSFLWKTSLKYSQFNTHFSTSLDEYVTEFTTQNNIEVCPFCGIENIRNREGESRTDIDHWLNKTKYPYVAVNFDNLVPIGKQCNSRAVKGDKEVIDSSGKNTQVLYPYCNHQGVSVFFRFIKEPKVSSDKIKDTDWELKINPNRIQDKDIFKSWINIFNIQQRYESTLKRFVLNTWKDKYTKFIDKSTTLIHAEDLNIFKNNLNEFKNTFDLRDRDESVIYIAFLDYMIGDKTNYSASNNYLIGIMNEIKSQVEALKKIKNKI